jgi:hypothetical protein
MKKLFSQLAPRLAACAMAASLAACSSTSKLVTTQDNLVETPSPPNYYYPFDLTPDEGKQTLNIKDFINKLPLQKPDSHCTTSVADIEVLTSGPVEGDLKFNTKYRNAWNGSDEDDFSFNETNNDNAELGGVATGNLYLYYKYEVKISYVGNLKNAFYGQMMAKEVVPMDSNSKEVCFRSETPQNDNIGRVWRVTKDLPPIEVKKKYPSLEIEGQTVRWVNCVGGGAGIMGVGFENKSQYLIVYAGACGKITNLKVYRIDFPANQKPIMQEVPDISKEVTAITYFPDP